MIHFLGIGAQKAGTTWLYRLLGGHPDISFPAGKELHFWDRCPNGEVSDYLARFPVCGAEKRQGEITPAYALLEVDSIRKIHAANPDIRLFFVLRNPIERAWSSALMALQRAEMQADEASNQWFLDHFRSHGSLARGDYEATLRRWHTVFAAEQLLVMRFEHISREPLGLLQRCAAHLDVAPGWFASVPGNELKKRVFAGSGEKLEPQLRAELQALYAPRIVSLQRYLQCDLSEWLES